MTDDKQDQKLSHQAVELPEEALDAAAGGLIGLLLPAVQKMPSASLGDGSVRIVSSGVGGTG